MFLPVKPTGGKHWRWKYRLQGKENLFAIGGFPQVSLAEARAAREKARALLKQGIHPAHERRQVKERNLEALEERKHAKESSFAKVAQAYLAEIKPVFALSSYRTKESRIRKYLSPKFDGMPMSDIGVKQIRPLLEECKATVRGRPSMSKAICRPSSSLRWCGGWSRLILFPVFAGCCACRSARARRQ
ncbi:integrase arm-type DNA-binding domain-containing protein [Bordetella pertussis]